jgi:hypothetical protein
VWRDGGANPAPVPPLQVSEGAKLAGVDVRLTTGFRREGQVDAQAQVTEQSAPTGERADMVNPASAYCE